MKSYIFIILLLISFLTPAFPKIYTTASYGNWDEGSIWTGGVVPGPFVKEDTVILKYPIVFQHNIDFETGALLLVDSDGALCGHHNITISSGARLISYGLVEVDSLLIPGGNVLLYMPSHLIITKEAILTISGASLVNNGSPVEVGPWFNCHLPEYNKFTAIETIKFGINQINIFPNPNDGRFCISKSHSFPHSMFYIMDVAGRILISKMIDYDFTNVDIINLPEAKSGIYLYKYIEPDGMYTYGKIEIRK